MIAALDYVGECEKHVSTILGKLGSFYGRLPIAFIYI